MDYQRSFVEVVEVIMMKTVSKRVRTSLVLVAVTGRIPMGFYLIKFRSDLINIGYLFKGMRFVCLVSCEHPRFQ